MLNPGAGRHRWATVLAVSMILLAGCPDPGTPTPDGPETPANGTPNQFPPGASPDGLSTELVDQHAEQLDEASSYTFRRAVATDENIDTMLAENPEYILRVEASAFRTIDPEDGWLYSQYHNGSRLLFRSVEPDDEERFSVARVNRSLEPDAPVTLEQGVREWIDRFEFSYEGEVEIGVDETGLLYVATDVPVGEDELGIPNVNDATIRVFVDTEGTIRRVEVTATVEVRGQDVPITIATRVNEVGDTDVSEPGWADEAIE